MKYHTSTLTFARGSVEIIGSKLMFERIGQIGILTRDVEETDRKSEEYLGIGPFRLVVTDYKNKVAREHARMS